MTIETENVRIYEVLDISDIIYPENNRASVGRKLIATDEKNAILEGTRYRIFETPAHEEDGIAYLAIQKTSDFGNNKMVHPSIESRRYRPFEAVCVERASVFNIEDAKCIVEPIIREAGVVSKVTTVSKEQYETVGFLMDNYDAKAEVIKSKEEEAMREAHMAMARLGKRPTLDGICD